MLNKEIIYEKNKTLLEIIFHLGGGVMFTTHLYEFMGFKHKTQMWRSINELERAGLIEKIKFHKHCIIKVKKFAIKKLLDKGNVDSIQITGYKILKSATISAVILKDYKHLCKTPEDFLKIARKYSTFYIPSDKSIYLLEQIINFFDKCQMDSSNLQTEVRNIVNDKSIVFKDYRNINCYVEKYQISRKDTNEFIFGIAVLDLSLNFDYKKVANRLVQVFMHYNSILGNELRIKGKKSVHYYFTFYVNDENRKEYLSRQLKKAKEAMSEMNIDMSRISLLLSNLNLTSTIFSNQKIIL
jgi:hypothetical protein